MLLADLTTALGEDRVLTGDDVRRQHGTDESWHPPAAPDVVVMPHSTEEAAAVVRACAQAGTPIVPFGAGTSLEGHVAALHGGAGGAGRGGGGGAWGAGRGGGSRAPPPLPGGDY